MMMEFGPFQTGPLNLSFVVAHQSSKEISLGWEVKACKLTCCRRPHFLIHKYSRGSPHCWYINSNKINCTERKGDRKGKGLQSTGCTTVQKERERREQQEGVSLGVLKRTERLLFLNHKVYGPAV